MGAGASAHAVTHEQARTVAGHGSRTHGAVVRGGTHASWQTGASRRSDAAGRKGPLGRFRSPVLVRVAGQTEVALFFRRRI
jgi:hypothetical protein